MPKNRNYAPLNAHSDPLDEEDWHTPDLFRRSCLAFSAAGL